MPAPSPPLSLEILGYIGRINHLNMPNISHVSEPKSGRRVVGGAQEDKTKSLIKRTSHVNNAFKYL